MRVVWSRRGSELEGILPRVRRALARAAARQHRKKRWELGPPRSQEPVPKTPKTKPNAEVKPEKTPKSADNEDEPGVGRSVARLPGSIVASCQNDGGAKAAGRTDREGSNHVLRMHMALECRRLVKACEAEKRVLVWRRRRWATLRRACLTVKWATLCEMRGRRMRADERGASLWNAPEEARSLPIVGVVGGLSAPELSLREQEHRPRPAWRMLPSAARVAGQLYIARIPKFGPWDAPPGPN